MKRSGVLIYLGLAGAGFALACSHDQLRGMEQPEPAATCPDGSPREGEGCPEPATPPPDPGGVRGRICGADHYWLAGARVSIELADASVIATRTDAQGRYELDAVPAGVHTARVRKGSFFATFVVEVRPGEVTVIPDPVCVQPTARLAVVTGMWDDVQSVLGELGLLVRATYDASGEHRSGNARGHVDLIAGEQTPYWIEIFLADPLWLGEYEIVFLNCGLDDRALLGGGALVDQALTNLRTYVEAGGSLYVSDWASEVIRLAFPGRINFYGSDAVPDVARVGRVNHTQAAVAVDPELRSALGHSLVTINFGQPSWVVLEPRAMQIGPLEVLVAGNVRIAPEGSSPESVQILRDVPMVVKFAFGAGRVLYTSAHSEGQDTPDLRQILNYIVFEL